MNGSLRATVLTPAGGGAIAVIRLAGDNPRSILDRCFRPGRSAPVSTMDANRLRYGAFVAGDEVLDDVLVCVHEVNRVAVVDITAHGGLRVVGRILETMESLGARIEDGVDDASAAWPATNEIEREALRALARTTTVLAAMSAAGGPLFPADLGSVEVLRRQDRPDVAARGSHRVDLKAVREGRAGDLSLRAGDIVRVPSSTVLLVPWGIYSAVSSLIRVGANFPLI